MKFLQSTVSRLWPLVWGLLVWLLTAGQAHSQTAPFVLEHAVWTDTSAQASFDQARQQTYTPYQGILSKGYTDSAHWVRLTIAASKQPLGLRITPAWLDSITLYDPANPEPPITVGDRHPARHSALPGLGHSFLLPAGSAPREVWLRLQTTSAHWLNAEVMPIEQVPRASSLQIIWAAFYAATLLLILLVLLVIWWSQYDRVLRAYLLRHAVYTVYGSSYLGLPTLLLSDRLPAAVLDQVFSFSAVLMLPVSIYFDQTFLSGYNPRRLWLRLLQISGWLGVGVALVLLAGHTRLALQLNVFALMIGSTLLLLTALSCQATTANEQVIPKKWGLAYYLLVFSSVLIGMSSLQGWFEPSEWRLYALILHGLATSLLMAAILIVRAQRMARQSQQVRWQLSEVQRNMAQEQRRRQEQTQFLHMLTHELKTPLGVARISLGASKMTGPQRERIERALANINAIVDRCRITDQLEHQQLLPHTEPCELLDLVDDCIATCSTPQRVKVSERNPARVPSDSQLLTICLANLIDNALKYSPTHTMVEIRVQPETAGVRLRVRNAIGPAGTPDPEQIFSKYYRSPGALSKSGSGLGLYLTRSMTQLLGAQLTYSTDATHVEFCLWIPA